MRTKKAEKDILVKNMDKVKTKIKELNEEVLQVSDDFVDESLRTTAKWQRLMAKGLKGGTDLLGKQQEMMFTTLGELKTQYFAGTKRFKKLVGKETRKTTRKATPVKSKKRTVASKTKTTVKASAKSDPKKENLTLIRGIGPKIEVLLNKAGIYNFQQILAAEAKDLKLILDNAGSIYKAHNPVFWQDQAREILSAK